MKTKDKLKAITTRLLNTKTDDQMLVAFTVLISRDRYRSAIHSGNPIDYLAKDLKRHLKSKGIDPFSMWFTLELSGSDTLSNPHIHGLLRIERHQLPDLNQVLQKALGKVSKSLARFKKNVQEYTQNRWEDYCCKDLEETSGVIGRKAVYISRSLTTSKSSFFGKTYTCKNSQMPCYQRAEAVSGEVQCSSVINTLSNQSKLAFKSTSKKALKSEPENLSELLEIYGIQSNSPP